MEEMSGDDTSDRRGSEVQIFIRILKERNESMYHGAEAIRMSRSERIPPSTAVDAHAMKYNNKFRQFIPHIHTHKYNMRRFEDEYKQTWFPTHSLSINFLFFGHLHMLL